MGGMMSVMEVTYGDDEAYVRLGRGEVAHSHEVAPGVILDVAEDGAAVGLELLGLRSRGLRAGQVEVRLAARSAGHEADEERLAELLTRGATQAS
jgi:uncharacterized protein YuzE